MKIDTFFRLIKLPQSLLALPWALSGALAPFLIGKGTFSLWTLFWIVCAFLTARTAGMCANRLIDAHFDALNPRTASRLLPSGQLQRSQVWVMALGASLLFLFSAGMINTLCLLIAPLPLALIWGYSFTKRFTASCHFVLGAIEFLAPVCAWIAVTGELEAAPVFLGLAFMSLISGADIVYALQDLNFDRQHGLHSVPVFLGKEKALFCARCLHVVSCLCLALFAFSLGLHFFYVGCLVVAFLLVLFHQQSRSGCLTSLSWVSLAQFIALLGEWTWRTM